MSERQKTYTYVLEPGVRREVEKRMTIVMATPKNKTRDKFRGAAYREGARYLRDNLPEMGEAVIEWIKDHDSSVEDVMAEFDAIYKGDSSKGLRVQVENAAEWARIEKQDAG